MGNGIEENDYNERMLELQGNSDKDEEDLREIRDLSNSNVFKRNYDQGRGYPLYEPDR